MKLFVINLKSAVYRVQRNVCVTYLIYKPFFSLAIMIIVLGIFVDLLLQ